LRAVGLHLSQAAYDQQPAQAPISWRGLYSNKWHGIMAITRRETRTEPGLAGK
jgi:hypothetical protein